MYPPIPEMQAPVKPCLDERLYEQTSCCESYSGFTNRQCTPALSLITSSAHLRESCWLTDCLVPRAWARQRLKHQAAPSCLSISLVQTAADFVLFTCRPGEASCGSSFLQLSLILRWGMKVRTPESCGPYLETCALRSSLIIAISSSPSQCARQIKDILQARKTDAFIWPAYL